MPRMNRREDSVEWPARPDSAPGVHPKPGKMGICAVTRSELLCIINGQPDPDTLSTSPERQKLVSLLYNQYHRWFLNLPADLSSIDLAPAHVLALHMFYHASVINLHKTMLPDKAFLASSGPGQICIEAATSISHLLSAHRKQYNVHGINVFVVQALYEACTIHVRHRGGPLNQESDTFIHDVLSTFRELEFFQPWATRVLVDIMALVNDRLSKSESSRSSSDVASRNERYLPLPHATVRIWEPAAKLTSSDAPHSDLSSSEPPMKRPKFVREYFFNANPG
ncbi:hypothetical protein MMC25_005856 [Agyrium rufum]|nr:hypothetical protein [Agyrium rufum]